MSDTATAEDQELALIMAALAERQKESPLEFLELLPGQEGFNESQAKVILVFGGNRCLGGECEIFDPMMGRKRRIDSIDDDWFWVEAWDGKKKVKARAWRPFKKEIDDLYEIGLSNGESFTASLNHLVLTPFGYLSIFDCLLKCGGVLQQTTSESCLSVHASNEFCYQKKFVNSLGDYRHLHCLYGVPLPSAEDTCQEFSPLQDDVQKHIFGAVALRKDAQESKLKYSHLRQLIDRLSIQDALRQTVGLSSDILCRVSYKLYKSILQLHACQNFQKDNRLSMIESYLRRSICGYLQQGIARRSNTAYSITSYLAITSIHYKRRDVKWDFTVPDYHNYFLGGVVHHNSGKTTPCSKKVLDLGLEKRRKIWVCGETFQDSIAIQQTKIHQLVPRRQVKYGQFDEINGYTNRKLLLKNGTIYTFKSYDQGRTAFQSDDIDVVWCDEEPPLEIIREIKMRLIDRNGILIISMTSLKGITDFIREYFEDCDILESRHAPLVNKELPVHARKGNVDIFFLWTTDNKYIDQERLKDEISLMGETEIITRIYGMPMNLAGKIYMKFGRDTHVIPLDDAPTMANQLWHVLDPHDRKPWAMGWYLVNKNGTVYCVDEYPDGNFNEMLFDDKTFEDYARIIKEKEKILRELFNCGGRIRRIIDPNFGHKTVQMAERKGGQSKTTPVKELARLGLIYKDGIDALEAGHLEVRKWLHWEIKKLEDGRREYVVRPGFLLTDNCKNHINHLTRYSRKDIIAADGDVKDKVSPQQKYKDFCDLVRYLLMANPHWIEEKKWEAPVVRQY